MTSPTAPGLLSVEAARDAVLAVAEPVGTERIQTADALGRVTAETVTAIVSLPPWANSAMDGYAIRAADTLSATRRRADPARGRRRHRCRCGARRHRDARQRRPDRDRREAPARRGRRRAGRGDDAARCRGSTRVARARCHGPAAGRPAWSTNASSQAARSERPGATSWPAQRCSDLARASPRPLVALVAGAGVADIVVHRRPRIAVLATGDEVRAPGADLGPAGIPDANGPGLRALVAASGGEPIDLGIATDDLDDVLTRLRRGLDAGADALIVSGGVSVGPYDVVKTAIERIGRIDLWRVAVQPGKPFAFGVADRPDGGAPVLLFGLPGNPVSSAVTFELFVRPAIRGLAGRHDLLRPVDRAVLGEPVRKSHGRRAFLRVEAERDAAGAPVRDGQGRVMVHLAGGQDSHVISALAAADALAVVPEADDSLPAGAAVDLWWLDRA